MNEVLSVARQFLGSPEGVALQAALAWIVLDALMTAALEKKLGRFAPEAFSYFLEKVGGEYVGLLILGVAAYINPVLLAIAIPAIAAFVTTEANGAYQKIQAYIASLQVTKA
jgi:hypothetical protein